MLVCYKLRLKFIIKFFLYILLCGFDLLSLALYLRLVIDPVRFKYSSTAGIRPAVTKGHHVEVDNSSPFPGKVFVLLKCVVFYGHSPG